MIKGYTNVSLEISLGNLSGKKFATVTFKKESWKIPTFKNEKGELVPLRSVVSGKKPVVLFLAYYECPNLCGMFLNGALDGLRKLKWTPGKEFDVLTISIDPTETNDLATKKKANYLREYGRTQVPEVETGWHFWVNDKVASHEDEKVHVKLLANQVGFGYRYDKGQEQYAHSAAMMFLTPEGKVSRYLYGIEFRPNDMRLALVEAGERKIGSVMDRIMLFCYHYDPVTKKYGLYATNLMRAGGGMTVFVVGSVLIGFWRRNSRQSRRKEEEKI